MVLEAARRHSRYVIVASSSSVYGRDASLPTSEDHPTRPASPYAASKLAAESYTIVLCAFVRHKGPRPQVLQRLRAVPAGRSRVRRGDSGLHRRWRWRASRSSVHGDGTQTRDFTYVGDVMAVIADALRAGGDHGFTREPRLQHQHLTADADR